MLSIEDKSLVGVYVGGRPVFTKRLENSILIGVPFVGSILAVYEIVTGGITWVEISAFLLLLLCTGVAVSLGLHRYFSHASFKTVPVISHLLGAFGSMAFQGSIARWVADHRRHHAHTDDTGDVHSPSIDPWGQDLPGIRGFLHAHIGWMFDNTATDMSVYGRGLMNDPIIVFYTRTFWWWTFASLALPFAYGYVFGGLQIAWTTMLVAGCLRTTLIHNIVWAVNSFGHTVGEIGFEQNNTSRNNYVLAILTFGDGWHNNHHRFPRSYRQGLLKGQVDINARIIEFLAKRGLAWDLIDNSGIR